MPLMHLLLSGTRRVTLWDPIIDYKAKLTLTNQPPSNQTGTVMTLHAVLGDHPEECALQTIRKNRQAETKPTSVSSVSPL